MKRLVYSPSVKVWVKTDSGTINLSPYVVNCRVDRKVNEMSKAEIEIRNPRILQDGKPRFLFTQHMGDDGKVGPVFHPMDPITIVLERLSNKPIQVFTGYCDTVPYVQLFPGVTRITASCTLKRLQYTYWDPALPFVRDFMANYGWQLGGNGQVAQGNGGPTDRDLELERLADSGQVGKAIRSSNLNDSSIGNLLYAVLNEVGGWNPGNIYIQPLPKNITSIVANLYEQFDKDNEAQNKEVAKLLKDIIGNGEFGSGSVATGSSEGADASSDPGDVSDTEVYEGVRIASWIVPILKYAREKGWNGTINSGFRTREKQQELYDAYINGTGNIAAKPGTSNHEGAKFPRGAVDVEDHAKLNSILQNSKYKDKLKWFGSGDEVHFSHTGN
jgi:hypothetical protein